MSSSSITSTTATTTGKLRDSCYRRKLREFAHGKGLDPVQRPIKYIYCVEIDESSADFFRILSQSIYPGHVIRNVVWIDIQGLIEPIRQSMEQEGFDVPQERHTRSSMRTALRMLGYVQPKLPGLAGPDKSIITRHLQSVTGSNLLSPSQAGWNLFVQTDRSISATAAFYGYNEQEMADFFKQLPQAAPTAPTAGDADEEASSSSSCSSISSRRSQKKTAIRFIDGISSMSGKIAKSPS